MTQGCQRIPENNYIMDSGSIIYYVSQAQINPDQKSSYSMVLSMPMGQEQSLTQSSHLHAQSSNLSIHLSSFAAALPHQRSTPLTRGSPHLSRDAKKKKFEAHGPHPLTKGPSLSCIGLDLGLLFLKTCGLNSNLCPRA